MRGLLLVFVAILLPYVVTACPTQFATMPIQQPLTIKPNCTVQIRYNFDTPTGTHLMMLCLTANLQSNGELPISVGYIVWQYRGRQYSGTLPITLKTNSNFEGRFIDAAGALLITNNTSQSLDVGCVFAY